MESTRTPKGRFPSMATPVGHLESLRVAPPVLRNAVNVSTATAMMNAEAMDTVEPRDVNMRFATLDTDRPWRPRKLPNVRAPGCTDAVARRNERAIAAPMGRSPLSAPPIEAP